MLKNTLAMIFFSWQEFNIKPIFDKIKLSDKKNSKSNYPENKNINRQLW